MKRGENLALNRALSRAHQGFAAVYVKQVHVVFLHAKAHALTHARGQPGGHQGAHLHAAAVQVEQHLGRARVDAPLQLEGEEARFMLNDPGSPTMIRDDSDDHALYVLMPMRV